MSYKSRDSLCISHKIPGFIGHYHLYEDISGEYLSRLDLSLPILHLYSVLGRHDNIENKVLHPSVLDDLFYIYLNFVFMTGISMNYIPFGLTIASQTFQALQVKFFFLFVFVFTHRTKKLLSYPLETYGSYSRQHSCVNCPEYYRKGCTSSQHYGGK